MDKYFRHFMILTKSAATTSGQGRCVIEARGDEARIDLYVQGLKPNAQYTLLLIANENDENAAVTVGAVRTDGHGKSEHRFKTDTKNAFRSGKAAETFRAAIVGTTENGIHASLTGFKNEPFNWERRLIHIKDVVTAGLSPAVETIKEVAVDTKYLAADISSAVHDAKKIEDELKDGAKTVKDVMQTAAKTSTHEAPHPIVTNEEMEALLAPVSAIDAEPAAQPNGFTPDFLPLTVPVVQKRNKIDMLLSNNIKMYPFVKQSAECTWVRAEPSDLIGTEAAFLATSPFVTTRAATFKHIIVGAMTFGADVRYVIGVPDTLGDGDADAAAAGFTQFKTCLNVPEPHAHGYWLGGVGGRSPTRS